MNNRELITQSLAKRLLLQPNCLKIRQIIVIGHEVICIYVAVKITLKKYSLHTCASPKFDSLFFSK